MKNTYKASIPLHKPPRIKGEVSKEKLTDILNRNLDRYRAYARIAGENHADILVFPEFGLLPGNFTSKVKKDLLKSICEPLPQDFDGPDPEKHRIFHAASTMAKANRLVLVINLCTLHSQHENNIYVTDVVFDENGKYVTHYHKSHIFFKRIFSKPDEIKTVSFHSFEVEFGLIICFDLFWKNPKANLFKKGIKHYPYCYAMRWVGRMVARLWSWCGKIVVIGANLGKYVGIFQKGKEVKHDIMDDVYFGVVE